MYTLYSARLSFQAASAPSRAACDGSLLENTLPSELAGAVMVL